MDGMSGKQTPSKQVTENIPWKELEPYLIGLYKDANRRSKGIVKNFVPPSLYNPMDNTAIQFPTSYGKQDASKPYGEWPGWGSLARGMHNSDKPPIISSAQGFNPNPPNLSQFIANQYGNQLPITSMLGQNTTAYMTNPNSYFVAGPMSGINGDMFIPRG